MNKKDLKNGAIVELGNGKQYIVKDNLLCPLDYEFFKLDCFNDNLNYEISYYDFDNNLNYKNPNYDIVKVDNSNHLDINWTWERKEDILTDEEKAYLKAVIEPVKDNVTYIKKKALGNDVSYIYIGSKNPYACNYINLYDFSLNSQFEGMELDKKYTLEELGLE